MEEVSPASRRRDRRERSLISVTVRLGLLLPIALGLASIVLLAATNRFVPTWHAPVLFGLIILWAACWAYASVVLFRAALAEGRNTWLAGVLLFLVPFQAWLVISTGVRDMDRIIGLLSS